MKEGEVEHKDLVSAWISTRLMIAWIATAVVVAATVVSLKVVDATKPKYLPGKVRVDTLRIYDSVTVIARAKDTVRIIEQTVGLLTEQRIAALICFNRHYGDKRDEFRYNDYGMIFCPKTPDKK